jgi:hypothetical protein
MEPGNKKMKFEGSLAHAAAPPQPPAAAVDTAQVFADGSGRPFNLTFFKGPAPPLLAELQKFYEKTLTNKKTGDSWRNEFYLRRWEKLLQRDKQMSLATANLLVDNNVYPFPVQPFLSVFAIAGQFYSFRADIFQTLVRCRMRVLLVLAEIRPTGPELRSIPGGSSPCPEEDGGNPTAANIRAHAWTEFSEEIIKGNLNTAVGTPGKAMKKENEVVMILGDEMFAVDYDEPSGSFSLSTGLCTARANTKPHKFTKRVPISGLQGCNHAVIHFMFPDAITRKEVQWDGSFGSSLVHKGIKLHAHALRNTLLTKQEGCAPADYHALPPPSQVISSRLQNNLPYGCDTDVKKANYRAIEMHCAELKEWIGSEGAGEGTFTKSSRIRTDNLIYDCHTAHCVGHTNERLVEFSEQDGLFDCHIAGNSEEVEMCFPGWASIPQLLADCNTDLALYGDLYDSLAEDTEYGLEHEEMLVPSFENYSSAGSIGGSIAGSSAAGGEVVAYSAWENFLAYTANCEEGGRHRTYSSYGGDALEKRILGVKGGVHEFAHIAEQICLKTGEVVPPHEVEFVMIKPTICVQWPTAPVK